MLIDGTKTRNRNCGTSVCISVVVFPFVVYKVRSKTTMIALVCLLFSVVVGSNGLGCDLTNLQTRVMKKGTARITSGLAGKVAISPATGLPTIVDLDENDYLRLVVCEDSDCNSTLVNKFIKMLTNSENVNVQGVGPVEAFTFDAAGFPVIVVRIILDGIPRPMLIHCNNDKCSATPNAPPSFVQLPELIGEVAPGTVGFKHCMWVKGILRW